VTDKIMFYHNPQSRGRIVHWMLEASTLNQLVVGSIATRPTIQ
jgi:hypothetical protein